MCLITSPNAALQFEEPELRCITRRIKRIKLLVRSPNSGVLSWEVAGGRSPREFTVTPTVGTFPKISPRHRKGSCLGLSPGHVTGRVSIAASHGFRFQVLPKT